MAEQNKNNIDDEAEAVEKILVEVVKSRKTMPAKCTQLDKESFACELDRLKNAKFILEDNQNKECFSSIIQGLKGIRSFQFSLQDLHKAEKKLIQYHKRSKEINTYLERKNDH